MEIAFCRLIIRISPVTLYFRFLYNTTHLSGCERMTSQRASSPSVLKQFSWISKLAPCFRVNGRQVEVIRDPSLFYNTLLKEISQAKERIVLASLYLGTSPLEEKLVNCVYDAVSGEKCSDSCSSTPKVHILLDCNRGSRGSRNSRTMLTPLIRDFPERVKVSLFHSPDLRGSYKRWLPERYNEVVGLQHMKIYIFDDNVLLSGANLSESYFTNRQDRYVIIRKCRALADFFHQLVTRVSSVSFTLKADDTLELAEGLNHHPYEESDNGKAYRKEAREKILDLIDPSKFTEGQDQSEERLNTDDKQTDTYIYPLVQMAPFQITQDYNVTQMLFCKAPLGSHIKLASGYFNLTEKYVATILRQSLASFNILMASPEANGFYGGKGISGYIPDTYTCIAKQFQERVCSKCQQERIHLQEYRRQGWTFHAKGLWLFLPYQTLPSMTLMGSPNFGYRSVYRDLEAQVAIVTENIHLRKQLHLEQHELYSKSTSLTEHILKERYQRVPLWVILVTPIIRSFF